MTILYDEHYFTDGGEVGGYTNYNGNIYQLKTYAQLITRLGELSVGIVGKKVLDVGCAHGFLVKYLVSLGVDAYGMDTSEYAVSQVPPEIVDRIILGDATIEADFIRAKELAGLTKKNDKFDLIIDQETIVCLNDVNAKIYCDLSKKYGNYLIHFMVDSPHISQWYNYHTIDEWITLSGLSPKEKWYAKPGWSEK